MNKKIVTKVFFLLLGTVGTCWACGCTKNLAEASAEKQTCPVETILKQLNQKTTELKTYQSRIEYLFSQPLFESEALRRGVLYYQKSGGKSKLRINFNTLKQDDEKEQKYVEQYIFDGVWLTKIDYQLKQVTKRQLAEPNEPNEPNKPVNAFELASRNFPIIGFTKIEDLKKQFEIKLIEQEIKEPHSVIPAKAGIHEFIQLHLKVKPDSVYKDDYTSIDFWIDKKLKLPAKIVAVSTEPDIYQPDIYQIRLLKPKINKKLKRGIFEFKIPRGFGEEIIPLKKKNSHSPRDSAVRRPRADLRRDHREHRDRKDN